MKWNKSLSRRHTKDILNCHMYIDITMIQSIILSPFLLMKNLLLHVLIFLLENMVPAGRNWKKFSIFFVFFPKFQSEFHLKDARTVRELMANGHFDNSRKHSYHNMNKSWLNKIIGEVFFIFILKQWKDLNFHSKILGTKMILSR